MLVSDALATLKAGFEQLAGYSRLLLYRVPREQAPTKVSAVFTRGPQEWWEFVQERRGLDTGDFTIVAARCYTESEAQLVLGWGSRFNTFLLVEPLDAFDLQL
jgi:hypothetical protein